MFMMADPHFNGVRNEKDTRQVRRETHFRNIDNEKGANV